MATVLCVSGDPQVRADVEEALRANGFRCVSATDRPSARAAFQSYLPETLVCDLRLPADLAHELCQYALAAAGVPTIMLGATPDETEELIAFAVGAADYLVWPGSARILAARTRVATRRNAENLSARTGCADIVDFESIVLVRSRRQVSVHSELVHLTRTEFDILALLMDSPLSLIHICLPSSSGCPSSKMPSMGRRPRRMRSCRRFRCFKVCLLYTSRCV